MAFSEYISTESCYKQLFYPLRVNKNLFENCFFNLISVFTRSFHVSQIKTHHNLFSVSYFPSATSELNKLVCESCNSGSISGLKMKILTFARPCAMVCSVAIMLNTLGQSQNFNLVLPSWKKLTDV